MNRGGIIDFVGFVVLLVWVGLSAFFAWSSNGDFFSRMGAAGAAYAVAYFALLRHGEIVPNTLVAQLREMRRMQNFHSENIHKSYRNSALVAVDLDKTRKEIGLEPTLFGQSMKQAFALSSKNEDSSAASLDSKFLELDSATDTANARVKSVRQRSETLQAIVLVLSTLQWGFGDLLV